jgi:hypothetical protein
MKMSSTIPCTIANGGSDPVGASACRAGTFRKPCATRTNNCAADKNPPPDAREAKAVIGGNRGDKQNEREHAHRARRVKAERRQRETGQARQDRRQKENSDRRLEILAEQKAVQHRKAGEYPDQTYRHVELQHCRLPNLGREANQSIVARVSPSGNFFLLPPRYNIYMSRRAL